MPTPGSRAPLILFACAVLSACSGKPDVPAAPTVLLRGLGPEPDSLDPQRATSAEAVTVLRDLCEGLTTLDKHAAAAPGAAATFAVSPDGKIYTFHLRPNGRWSTGEKVVAADFVAAFRRLANPATASNYQRFAGVIAHAPEIFAGKEPPEQLAVSAPDDSTVVIQLSSPTAYFPQLVAHTSTCPVHRSAVPPTATLSSHVEATVSNGAFALKEWIPGSHIALTANPYYWNNSATRLNGVRYLFIPNANDELTRYRAGALHITSGVSRAQFDWVRSTLGGELHLSPQLGTYFYGFNLNRAPFKDNPKLRRALSLSIDREKLTGAILRAGELPAYGWLPPGVNNYTPQDATNHEANASSRLAEARRLYAEAGYSATKPLHFELRYNNGEAHSKLAIAIAAMWHEALGIDVTLTAEEFASLLQDIDQGNLEMFRSSWMADYNDAYNFAQFFENES
ncbi:MAG TPA: peptide ABC transporter substrate-binding protein, partial [Steroidobacteraceae bacterium]